MIYKATILPSLDYGCISWRSCSKKNPDFLERVQNKAVRTILRANHLTCPQTMRDKLGLSTLSSTRRFIHLQLVFKTVNNQLCPTQLHNYMTLRSECHGRTLRDRQEIRLPKVKSTIGQSTFKYTKAKDWNESPNKLWVDGHT